MTSADVERWYGLAVIAALVMVAYLAFTVPIPTAIPEAQQTRYSNVPVVLAGPPVRATGAAPGEALAYLRIPRLGPQWLWVASEGTDTETLAAGPGHFTGSALPGEDGNSAYAGHRSGHGDPFLNFDRLRPGDQIVVAQDGAEWIYKVRFSPRVIEPTESWITQQHTRSGRAFAAPRLTLMTCWPKYGSSKRMYVRAVLIETRVKA